MDAQLIQQLVRMGYRAMLSFVKDGKEIVVVEKAPTINRNLKASDLKPCTTCGGK